MGVGQGKTRRIKSSGSNQVLVGDWIQVTKHPLAFPYSLVGQFAEVNGVHNGGDSISIIVGGKLCVGLDKQDGDNWVEALPPTSIPPSWIRSDAAPSAGLPTAHTWISRKQPTNPLVTDKMNYRGWMRAKKDLDGDIVSVIDAVQCQVFETGEPEGWDDAQMSAMYPQSYGNSGQEVKRLRNALGIDTSRKAEKLGALVGEADCLNDGFIVHATCGDYNDVNITDSILLEIDMQGNVNDLKGFEAIVEKFEELGFSIDFDEACRFN